MKKWLNWLLAILVFLLPLANLGLQFLLPRLSWSQYLFFYKDLLLLPILAYLIWQVASENWQKLQTEKKNWLNLIKFNWELILLLILHLLILISSLTNHTAWSTFSKAYYFEIWWLDFFVLMRIWLKEHKLKKIPELAVYLKFSLIFAFILVNLIGIASLIFGQNQVLTTFGYSTDYSVVEGNTTSLISTSPVCHNIDAGIDRCRLMASFTHPIHLASYLLVMLCLLLVWFLESKTWLAKILNLSLIISGIVLIYETFARYSWITIFLLTSCLLAYTFYLAFKRFKFSLLLAKIILISSILVAIFTGQIVFNTDLKDNSNLPNWLVKSSSNEWHYRRTAASVDILKAKPEKFGFGYGLGAIGSSARAKYQDLNQNYIYQNYKSIADKYYLKLEDMLILDNWFLGVLISGGIYYFTVYLLLLLLPLTSLWTAFRQKKWDKQSLANLLFGVTFLGILIGSGLQLLFESQTLAIYWTILYFFSVKNKYSL
jgi:hypothetical protein